MKGGASGRSDGNAAAAAILIAVLLGCFAISAQCGDGGVPIDLAGKIGEVVAAAGSPGDERPSSAMAQPVCYKACGNGRCDFCCASPYTPTFCWETEAKCKQECHPPIRRVVFPHHKLRQY
ncbi:hypothetical protein C2845_PM10G12930 [Panicum miliaceum]|uniref:Uncharacterized protein n=1 Tax=Panicum miliaceum TaxID=4540 RepID=A0A3L6PDI1_PANMI|nr:hypothetical protein C2845_PM10G12930 [Panicum miliaceum]